LGEPYYDNLGLPFHRSYAADAQPLKPGRPVELVFDLQPTSNIFDAGNRLRITVVGADADNATPLTQDPPPTVKVYRNKRMASYVNLPVVGAEAKPGEPVVGEKGFSLAVALLLVGIVGLVIVFAFWRRGRFLKQHHR
jgi:X-Pro dipeptidyl-peptidase C-terminal non-catalytic domain